MVESKNNYAELLIKSKMTDRMEVVFIALSHVFNVSKISMIVSGKETLYFANRCHLYTKYKGLSFDEFEIISVKEAVKPNLIKKVRTHDNL